jgi:hypothetical protein
LMDNHLVVGVEHLYQRSLFRAGITATVPIELRAWSSARDRRSDADRCPRQGGSTRFMSQRWRARLPARLSFTAARATMPCLWYRAAGWLGDEIPAATSVSVDRAAAARFVLDSS